MWSIDVRNLVKNKLLICRDWHIQPSEIDKMPYYEYETYRDTIQEIVKKEEEERKRREKEQKSNTPKPPNMNSFKPPKVSIPRF